MVQKNRLIFSNKRNLFHSGHHSRSNSDDLFYVFLSSVLDLGRVAACGHQAPASGAHFYGDQKEFEWQSVAQSD